MKIVDENEAWRTHGIVLRCAKVGCMRCPTRNSNEIRWLEEEKKEFGWIEKREGKKERKKEQKKKRKEKIKKMEEVPTLQEVGFFSYLGYLCLGVIPWPWS